MSSFQYCKNFPLKLIFSESNFLEIYAVVHCIVFAYAYRRGNFVFHCTLLQVEYRSMLGSLPLACASVL